MAGAKGGGSKPDLATFGGFLVGIGAILGGLLMEGGKFQDVRQVSAAVIVFGGTFGAVMVSNPPKNLMAALRAVKATVFEKALNPAGAIEEIIRYATKARKSGIVSLEQDAEAASDPFLRKALNLAVDGTDLQQIRKIMELELSVMEARAEAEAKVFEQAGGYAPTVGIIGAVMGLIQVMKNLANIDEVGRGIAVAFVATVYGVGSANLVFLPIGSKIKARAHQAVEIRELMLEGVIAIVEGLNPKLIRTKLEAYAGGAPAPAAAAAGKAKGATQTAPQAG